MKNTNIDLIYNCTGCRRPLKPEDKIRPDGTPTARCPKCRARTFKSEFSNPIGTQQGRGITPTRKLEQAYDRLSNYIETQCGSSCGRPGVGCTPEACHKTIAHAKKEYGLDLPHTKHRSLPLMGQFGCSIPRYMRPECSSYVCEKHLRDADFSFQYKWLLEDAHFAEAEATAIPGCARRGYASYQDTSEQDSDL